MLFKGSNEASKKVTHAIRQSEMVCGGSAELAILKERHRHEYVLRLQDFINARINEILFFVKLEIKPKLLMEKLDLSLGQIKELCQVKLRHNETNMRIA